MVGAAFKSSRLDHFFKAAQFQSRIDVVFVAEVSELAKSTAQKMFCGHDSDGFVIGENAWQTFDGSVQPGVDDGDAGLLRSRGETLCDAGDDSVEGWFFCG